MSSRIARRSAASEGEMVTCLLMGWCPCSIRSGTVAQSLEDGARFQKCLDPERAEFTADAGMLEPALSAQPTRPGEPAVHRPRPLGARGTCCPDLWRHAAAVTADPGWARSMASEARQGNSQH